MCFGFVKTLGFVYARICNDYVKTTTNNAIGCVYQEGGGEREMIMDGEREIAEDYSHSASGQTSISYFCH